MSEARLHGWVFAASIRGAVRVDDALTASEALLELDGARVEGAAAGPAFADEGAAVAWLKQRSAELALTTREVGGWLLPRTPVVLVCAGAPLRAGLRPRTAADLFEYLASPECVGFSLVAPPIRQDAWVLRAGFVVVGFLLGLVGAAVAAFVADGQGGATSNPVGGADASATAKPTSSSPKGWYQPRSPKAVEVPVTANSSSDQTEELNSPELDGPSKPGQPSATASASGAASALKLPVTGTKGAQPQVTGGAPPKSAPAPGSASASAAPGPSASAAPTASSPSGSQRK